MKKRWPSLSFFKIYGELTGFPDPELAPRVILIKTSLSRFNGIL